MTQNEQSKGEREELYLLYQNAAANLAELKKSQWQVLVFFSAIVAFLIVQADNFSCFLKAILSFALVVGAVSAIMMLEAYWRKLDKECEVLKCVYGRFSQEFNDCRKVKGESRNETASSSSFYGARLPRNLHEGRRAHHREAGLMGYDPNKHHRRSVRLKGYDYAQAGAYFVTICTQNRGHMFGEVVNEEMRLNDAGRLVQSVWDGLPGHYPGVETDAFVIMPNHIHGIVVLVGAGPRACLETGQPRGVAPTLSLSDVVHRFKTLITKRYADGVKQFGWLPFCGHLWQRNYYEHIIRDEVSLNRIRQYIIDNPARWAFDRENPQVTTPEPEDGWSI